MKKLLPWVILALALVGGYYLWQKYQGGGGSSPMSSGSTPA